MDGAEPLDDARDESQPRRVGVPCPVHGLHYNPEQSSGCVICLREKQNSRKLLWGLAVSGAGLLLVVYFATRPESQAFERSEATMGLELAAVENAPDQPISTARLSPEPYRDTISQLEAVLYQTSPPDYQDMTRASRLGSQLGQEIRQQEASRRVVPAMSRLLAWSAALDAAQDVGYAPADLTRARSEWESLREQCFQPAAWFRTASPNLERAQTPPPPTVNRNTVRGLQKVARDMHHLIAVGRPAALRIGEITGDVVTAETRRVENGWRRWRDDWLKKLQKVADSFPAHPGMSANPNVLLAYQAMGQALHELRIVTVPVNETGVPFIYQREANFRAAESHLREAEGYLDRLGL